jgi:hypothetical protein
MKPFHPRTCETQTPGETGTFQAKAMKYAFRVAP